MIITASRKLNLRNKVTKQLAERKLTLFYVYIITTVDFIFDRVSQAHWGQFTAVRSFFPFFSSLKSAAKLKSVCKVSQWGGSLQQNIPSFAGTVGHQAPPPEQRGKASETDRERIKKTKQKEYHLKGERLFLPTHFHPTASILATARST